MFGAFFHRALERESLVENGLFHALFKTLLVENMTATKDAYVLVIDFNHTDGTFCQLTLVSYQWSDSHLWNVWLWLFFLNLWLDHFDCLLFLLYFWHALEDFLFDLVLMDIPHDLSFISFMHKILELEIMWVLGDFIHGLLIKLCQVDYLVFVKVTEHNTKNYNEFHKNLLGNYLKIPDDC